MTKCASIIVDLGFGDAGKGLCTDAAARRLREHDAASPVRVVRFNGGAQAGHNVVLPDGRHHTFSQFGAAAFVPGAETVLLDSVVVHPTALWHEAQLLEAKGVRAPLAHMHIEPRALVTTPFHQAAGRIREQMREERHGSCGVGVGETMRDARIAEPIRFGDLSSAGILVAARAVQERLRASLQAEFGYRVTQDKEWRYLDEPQVAARWLEHCKGVATVQLYRREQQSKSMPLIFEGAQGVLLDETYGFAPYTTWSTCTFENAEQFLRSINYALPVEKVGVVRSYAVRHGAGPLPTEQGDTPLGNALRARERHNAKGPWQGDVRVGAFDAVLFKYACEIVGKLDELVITHMDAFASEIPVCSEYVTALAQLRAGENRSRAQQAELAQHLFAAQAQQISLSHQQVVQLLAKLSEAPRIRTCYGPTFADLRTAAVYSCR